MIQLKVVHEGGNTQQRMRHQVIGGPGDNITVSSSLLSLARVKLSQAGQYTCKPPGMMPKSTVMILKFCAVQSPEYIICVHVNYDGIN